jgi:signal transduction histidine kinase/ligand-binding sensor domain-containing protein
MPAALVPSSSRILSHAWRVAVLALAAIGGPAGALDRELSLAQLHHTAWSTRDGAPAQVESLAQTDDGTLWLGTAIGLFRFDGLAFEHFEPPPGQSGPTGSVSSLLAVPGRGLWIGYRFGGVGWWHDGRLDRFGRDDGVPPGTVTAFAQDADGRLWAGTSTGLVRFDGARWTKPPQAVGYPAGPTYAMHCDRAGTLWAVAEDGTWRLPRGAAAFARSSRSVSFAWLAERADGRVWESNGTQGLWPLPEVDGPPQLQAAVPGPGKVGPLLFDRDDALWVGTRGGFARFVAPDRLPPLTEAGDPRADDTQRFGREQGLSGDQVLAMLEDREGSVWLSTSGGLDRFRANKLTRAALPPDLLWPSLAPAVGEGVWVGSTEVAAARLGGDERRLPDVGPRITSALRDTRGAVWMGGARGLWRIADEAPRRLEVPPPIAGLPIQAMVDAGGGRLRMSVMREGQWEQDAAAAGGWRHVAEPPGGPDTNPLAMARDGRGGLWLGYAFDRLVRLREDGPPRAWHAADGLQVGSILCLKAQGARLWVGGETGLAVVIGDTVRAIRLEGDEPLAGISGIVADSADNVWLNTALGIVRLPAEELDAAMADPARRVVAERMDYRDGLDGAPAQLRPVPTAVAADDGRLWFATNNSVVWIDPQRIRRNRVPPPVQILALEAADRHWPLATTPTLPVGTRTVDLRFAAGSLAQPERVRFRVRLEGVDHDWQPPAAPRRAHYTNLMPGRYRFDVLAANEDGVWSTQAASLEFVVPPAFHQTWWFRAAWIPIALALAWGLMHWRLKRHAARLADRHEAMLIERERIARELHDTLLQSVQGLILRLQAGVDRMAPGDPVRASLERSLDRADEVLAEGRDRVSELRTPARGPQPLGVALRRFGEELAEEHGVAFAATLRGEGAPLPDRVQDEAAHIGREALRNAFAHAQALEVRLVVQQTPAWLVLEVADDGRGMPPTQEHAAGRAGHWGLAGMRERARAIGAHFTLESAPGEGTRVRLRVRLAPRAFGLLELSARWRAARADRDRHRRKSA